MSCIFSKILNPRGNGGHLVEGVFWWKWHCFRSAVSGEDPPVKTGDCVSGSQLNGRLPKARGSLTSNIISQSIRQITSRLRTPKEIQGSGKVWVLRMEVWFVNTHGHLDSVKYFFLLNETFQAQAYISWKLKKKKNLGVAGNLPDISNLDSCRRR